MKQTPLVLARTKCPPRDRGARDCHQKASATPLRFIRSARERERAREQASCRKPGRGRLALESCIQRLAGEGKEDMGECTRILLVFSRHCGRTHGACGYAMAHHRRVSLGSSKTLPSHSCTACPKKHCLSLCDHPRHPPLAKSLKVTDS